MLISMDTGQEIKTIPHREEFEIWKNRLAKEEYQRVYDKLYAYSESDEIHTSSWIPESDWAGTVFQPIYEKACNCNEEFAAKFFGLVLWKVFMDRPDSWGYGRYELNGIPILGMTYFRIIP